MFPPFISVREVISLADLSSGSYCTLSRPITSFYDFRSFIFSRPLDGLRSLHNTVGVCVPAQVVTISFRPTPGDCQNLFDILQFLTLF
jgi:hypothetical protein